MKVLLSVIVSLSISSSIWARGPITSKKMARGVAAIKCPDSENDTILAVRKSKTCKSAIAKARACGFDKDIDVKIVDEAQKKCAPIFTDKTKDDKMKEEDRKLKAHMEDICVKKCQAQEDQTRCPSHIAYCQLGITEHWLQIYNPTIDI